MKNNKFLVESISPLLLMLIGMTISNSVKQFSVSIYIFLLAILCVSLFQYIGSTFNKPILRICMAWISCIVWTCLSFVVLNTPLLLVTLCISIFNMRVFTVLVNQIDFDWLEFTQD